LLDIDTLATQFEARFEMQLKTKLGDTATFIFHTEIRDSGPITTLLNTFKAKFIKPKNAFQIGDAFQNCLERQNFSSLF
jgi:hypothetical protein